MSILALDGAGRDDRRAGRRATLSPTGRREDRRRSARGGAESASRNKPGRPDRATDPSGEKGWGTGRPGWLFACRAKDLGVLRRRGDQSWSGRSGPWRRAARRARHAPDRHWRPDGPGPTRPGPSGWGGGATGSGRGGSGRKALGREKIY